MEIKMENIYQTIITNGKYYQPASNHYLMPNPISGICHICTTETNLTHQDFENHQFCTKCVSQFKFMIKCDKCQAIFLAASIGYENYDLCLSCASELTSSIQLDFPSDPNFKPHNFWCFRSLKDNYIYINKKCTGISCNHEVYYQNETILMPPEDIIQLLKSESCGIPSHFQFIKDIFNKLPESNFICKYTTNFTIDFAKKIV
jgi:hypothetical protein